METGNGMIKGGERERKKEGHGMCLSDTWLIKINTSVVVIITIRKGGCVI
jgi:hypothetical protein